MVKIFAPFLLTVLVLIQTGKCKESQVDVNSKLETMRADIISYAENASVEYGQYQVLAKSKSDIYSIIRRETLLNSNRVVEEIHKDVRRVLRDLTRNCPKHNEEIDKCLDKGKSDIDTASKTETSKVKTCSKKDYSSMKILKLLGQEDWRRFKEGLELLMKKFEAVSVMAGGIGDLDLGVIESDRMRNDEIWLMAKQIKQQIFKHIDLGLPFAIDSMQYYIDSLKSAIDSVQDCLSSDTFNDLKQQIFKTLQNIYNCIESKKIANLCPNPSHLDFKNKYIEYLNNNQIN